MSNKSTTIGIVDEIIDLDGMLQQILRNSWPETWLQINLPVGSTRALFAIESKEARTPGGVAEALGVSRTTVTGMLDRLEGEGLLTRSIDPNDRRCFMLELTPKARSLIEEIEGSRRDRLNEALTSMSQEELQALRTGLGALLHQMQPPNL